MELKLINPRKFTNDELVCPKCGNGMRSRHLVVDGVSRDRARALNPRPGSDCPLLDEHLHVSCFCGHHVEMWCKDKPKDNGREAA